MNAITNVQQHVGKSYISHIKTGALMVHARLGIGADNSGKLVSKVKILAKQLAQKTDKKMILVDGSPGIGCPVIASLSGAKYVVLVTEPTVSGLHDLKRVYELVKKFGIKASCIVNKADLNQAILNELKVFLKENDISLLSEIPYDEKFTEAMTHAKTIVEWDDDLKEMISTSWEKIKKIVDVL